MLKDKGFDLKEGSVYGFRSQVTGEVIAKVISIKDKDVLVQQPLQLAQMQDGKVGMVPAFPLADEDSPMVFPLDGMVYFKVTAEAEEGYISATSKVMVPKKQGIITN